jgi:hypothetical protein
VLETGPCGDLFGSSRHDAMLALSRLRFGMVRSFKAHFLLVGSGISGLPGAGLTDELLSGIRSRP